MLEHLLLPDYPACRALLAERLREPAPARIQLLSGPRQVGKTTLLLSLRGARRDVLYLAGDGPEAALPGFWDRLPGQVEEVVRSRGRAIVMLDEVHLLPDWAQRLKAFADSLHRARLPVHVVASGSSALHLTLGSRESLAGRFEPLVLRHWSAASLAKTFRLSPRLAARLIVERGGFPGAVRLRRDPERWAAYVRNAIVEPAIGRDLLALPQVRRPALLRQLFTLVCASPAQVVSLQKLQARLPDAGALETLSHYLSLLESAYLVVALEKHSSRLARQRAAPPKLLALNNAFLAAMDPAGPRAVQGSPARFGAWLENACLAHAWSSGQQVRYWREEPLEVDAVLDGDWGQWAIEVKSGRFDPGDLRGLSEFCRRFPAYRPLVICDEQQRAVAQRAGLSAVAWQDFLVTGLRTASAHPGRPPGITSSTFSRAR